MYLPPAMVVGISYPAEEGFSGFYGRRNLDFFGPWDMQDEGGRKIQEVYDQLVVGEGGEPRPIPVGGASRFMEFLRDELLPALAAELPVDIEGRHVLMGASSAGHFVLRAIYDPRSPFRGYVCVSPALAGDPGAIERLEAEYAAGHDDLDAAVYLCAGTGELGVLAHEGLHPFHVGERGLAQAQCARSAQREFPQVHAEADAALFIPVEQSGMGEVADDAVRRR